MNAAEALEQKIRESIPLSDAMQFHIEALSLDAIEVVAPLPPNVNIHGTGFAGSIYSVGILTGWALCSHILEALEIEADLVVARAEIRYRAPVTGELRCQTGAERSDRDAFLQNIRDRGMGVLKLRIDVGEGADAVLNATFCANARD